MFSNCLIVKGNNRATICDLQRNKYVLIPISLANLFDKNNMLKYSKIIKQLSSTELTIFEEYMQLLNEKEFIFKCNSSEAKKFPALSMEFDYPSVLTNAVIDYDDKSKHDFDVLLQNFLIPSNCRHIQIRIFENIPFSVIEKLLKTISNSFIKSVQFTIKLPIDVDIEFIKQTVTSNRKIKSLILHSAEYNCILQEAHYGFGLIIAIKQNILGESHCGQIAYDYFNIRNESFAESLNHNSCLNRKISIDKDGNIKNCPSMAQSFGNIKDTTLQEALDHPDFKKYWNITKDQIEVCKDCEFRHICTDCRAYIEDPENQYSKPLKCGYNPYTNVWEEWSTNPLKQKAIEYYGMQDLIKKDA